MIENNQEDDQHFNKRYWYIVFSTALVFVYIFAVSFWTVPEKNQGMVNIILGVLLGNVLGAGTGYLLSGNPFLKKTDKPQTVNNNAPVATQNNETKPE